MSLSVTTISSIRNIAFREIHELWITLRRDDVLPSPERLRDFCDWDSQTAVLEAVPGAGDRFNVLRTGALIKDYDGADLTGCCLPDVIPERLRPIIMPPLVISRQMRQATYSLTQNLSTTSYAHRLERLVVPFGDPRATQPATHLLLAILANTNAEAWCYGPRDMSNLYDPDGRHEFLIIEDRYDPRPGLWPL